MEATSGSRKSSTEGDNHLTHLNLSHRGLGNGHLAQIYGILAAIPSNQVTHLNLSHNGLGAASAHPLPAAPSLPSLLYLDFHGNALGEVATPLLARALAFTSVQELNYYTLAPCDSQL